MKECQKCNCQIDNDSAIVCEKCGNELVTAEISVKNSHVQQQADVTPTHSYTPEFEGLFHFILWMVMLGGLLTPIMGFFSMDFNNYANSTFLMISDLSMLILTPIVAIYSVISTYKRRPGSVTLLKFYMSIVIVSKILPLFVTNFTLELIFFIFFLIVNIALNLIWLLYICFSSNVSDIFPENTRRTSTLDEILLWTYLILPVVSLFIGIIEIKLNL